MHPQCLVLVVIPASPQLLQKLLLSQHSPSVGRQAAPEAVFRGAELHLLTPGHNLLAQEIDGKFAASERGLGGGRLIGGYTVRLARAWRGARPVGPNPTKDSAFTRLTAGRTVSDIA